MDATLSSIQESIKTAVLAGSWPASQAAWQSLQVDETPLSSPAYWERLRVEVTEPLAAALTEEAAAEEGAAERQLQLEVEAAEALAARACAHLGCTTLLGPSGTELLHRRRCGGCRLARYCGVACQTADWPTRGGLPGAAAAPRRLLTAMPPRLTSSVCRSLLFCFGLACISKVKQCQTVGCRNESKGCAANGPAAAATLASKTKGGEVTGNGGQRANRAVATVPPHPKESRLDFFFGPKKSINQSLQRLCTKMNKRCARWVPLPPPLLLLLSILSRGGLHELVEVDAGEEDEEAAHAVH